MPPKEKITREMIVDAAFSVVREIGAENLNARTVAKALGCSTQPVMYHFKTMEALKRAVYRKADDYHSACLMSLSGDDPMLEIGLNYIRFGMTEKHLFRFLFQSNGFAGATIVELMDAGELAPILNLLCQQAGVSAEQAKAIFRVLFLTVHGYASMFANNEIPYEEAAIQADLTLVFQGLMDAVKGGM